MPSATTKSISHQKKTTKEIATEINDRVAQLGTDIVLSDITGHPEWFDGKKMPCYKCGGTDRQNYNQKKNRLFCNACNKSGSDAIDVVSKALGLSFYEASKRLAFHPGVGLEHLFPDRLNKRQRSTVSIADVVGVTPQPDKPISSDPPDPAKHLEFHGPNEAMATVWCAIHKKGIKPEALWAFGAQFATYRKRYPVFSIPIRGQKNETVGWCLYHATGKELPIFAKGSKQPVDWRKIKITSGSKPGWIGPIPKPTDRIIWKTEGPSCGMANYSLGLPEGHSVCCNAFGAEENPATTPWMLERFRDAEEVFVVHDSDKSGQRGATEITNENGTSRPGWAPAIANFAKQVRNYVLPWPMVDSHGQDLRDLIIQRISEGLTDGEIYQHILSNARLAPTVKPIAIKFPKGAISTQVVVEESDSSYEHIDDPHRLARINIENYRNDYKGELKYFRGKWYKYRLGQWRRLEDEEVSPKVSESIRRQLIKDQFIELEKWKSKGSEGKPPKTHKASDSLVRNVVSAMRGMCLVPSSVQMPCWLEDRTPKPYVSFTNGILDYERLCQNDENCLLPQSYNWFSLTTLPYAFDRNASCDRWQSFLEDALEGDLERIYVLQEYAGYILLPDNRFQKALAQEGIGSNGKTVVQAGLTAMLGEKNVSGLSIENFANSFSIGETVGKLLNIAADMGNVDQIAEGMLKQLIGGDRVFIDRKHRDGMTVRPTAKFIASWNDRPRIRDRSNGIWRRLIVMPFRKTISDERKKLGMDTSSFWSDEAPGICNWALIGLERLLRQNRFTQSKVCEDAAKAFKTESSPAAMYLSDYWEASAGSSIPLPELFGLFAEWCKQNGYASPPPMTVLGREVLAAFPKVEKRRSSLDGRPYVYDGIAPKKDEAVKK